VTFAERALYHQIHPAKLLTDWFSGILAAALFWEHRLLAGLLSGLVPPIILSALFLTGRFDATLARYRDSALGRYVTRYMSRAMEFVRLLGLAGLWVGAWERSPVLMAIGIMVILTAWVKGLFASDGP
jgi:hypothetical protein